MELQAVIEALRALKYPCKIELHSDCSYVVSAFNQGWLSNWKKNGWRTASGSEVSNRDLWEELDGLAGRHKIKWIKVKGHADNPYNNRCDELAVAETRKIKDQL